MMEYYCYKNGELLLNNVTILFISKQLNISKNEVYLHLNSKLIKNKYYISFRELSEFEIKRVYSIQKKSSKIIQIIKNSIKCLIMKK